MLFSPYAFWSTKIQIWTKSENLKIQNGGRLWRHLFDYRCNENQLNTKLFLLTESTNEAYCMCQISCQSDGSRLLGLRKSQRDRIGCNSNPPPLKAPPFPLLNLRDEGFILTGYKRCGRFFCTFLRSKNYSKFFAINVEHRWINKTHCTL